jgi:transposase
LNVEVRIRKEGSKKMTDRSMIVAGIDTGKLELHVCVMPGERRFTVKNDAAGIAALVEACRSAGVVRCGIESTSIYHRGAARALRQAGFAVVEPQPRQIKAFAQAVLQWSKSDPLDAKVIARFAAFAEPVRQGQAAEIEALSEPLTFIEQLEARIAWLKTSRERFADARIGKTIAADIKRLGKQRQRELKKLEIRLRKNEALARRLELLLSIPGIAERTALGFLIRMPELGQLTREQAASLAGLAPHLCDTGQFRGERHIYGGRERFRHTAFMAAFAGAMQWNKDLQVFYRRLVANGKTHTAAVVACARKLVILANAILARGTPWQDKRVMP